MDVMFQIEEVDGQLSKGDFLELPVRLYKNEPNWIRPLDGDIELVFDPEKNKMFQRGTCCRWILKNSNGHTVGRVAAFVDNKTRDLSDQPTGGMGFFECIDDEKAAYFLFDTCVEWLKNQGIEAMDGQSRYRSYGWANKFW